MLTCTYIKSLMILNFLAIAIQAAPLGHSPSEPLKRQIGVRPKANEYRSPDCSGPLNYGLNRATLEHVTMDDTSHSVYLAAPGFSWKGYSGKDKDGGHCTGNLLGDLPDKCVNLDNHSSERIRCVLWDR